MGDHRPDTGGRQGAIIEAERAKRQQAENARRNQPQSQNPENLPGSEIKEGDARDKAAVKVGMSSKTAEKAAKVASGGRRFIKSQKPVPKPVPQRKTEQKTGSRLYI